ncbi:MAG: hypothetical protein Q8P41_28550 [Pseudomonadota bacterium]|nr:hypothetical protein [Pseudomonadota bacterium]
MIGVLVLDGAGVHQFAYGPPEPGSVLTDLTPHVRACLDAAVGASVPWVADVRQIDASLPTSALHRSSPPGTYAPVAIRDGSYELSVALWRASRWMGVPLPKAPPGGLWASGRVTQAGAVEPVKGLAQKAAALPAGATLVVCADQVGDVGRADLRVVAVRTLREAVDTLWPAPVFPALGGDAADAAWTYALRQHGSRPWRAIAAGIERLAVSHPKAELAVAARVARRHGGAAEGLDDCTELLARLPLAVRLECAAHLLQGLADDATEGWETEATRWEPLVGPDREVFPPHLFVMGALGRLYASWRRYDTAGAWLDRAIAGWFALHEPGKASLALCERLRVEAILCAATPGRELDRALVRLAVESQRHQAQHHWIARALYRAAHAAGHRNLRERLVHDDPTLVTGWRWDPDVAQRGSPEEQALARLVLDPDDADAHATLATEPDGQRDYLRFQRCLAPGESLGTVLAREWRY